VNPYESLVNRAASKSVDQAATRVERLMKRMKDLLSGDDTPLVNLWEEYCVQLQFQESTLWEVYEDLITSLSLTEAARLDDLSAEAVWLDSEEGFEWAAEWENAAIREQAPVSPDVIAKAIAIRVRDRAADYRSPRIERFLMSR
jgi:hypothetical protein